MNDMETNVRKLQAEVNEYRKERGSSSSSGGQTDAALKAEIQHLQHELKKTKEEKFAVQTQANSLVEKNDQLANQLKIVMSQGNVEAHAAIEALKTQLSEALKEKELYTRDNLQLQKQLSDLEFASIQNEFSSDLNLDLQKQLEQANNSKKQTEEKVNSVVDRTMAQIQHYQNLNEQLDAKNQELHLDVEILIEELQLKEADIEGLVEDNNAMFEKLKYFGISVEYDDISGRIVFM